jgi:hypothetical protein
VYSVFVNRETSPIFCHVSVECSNTGTIANPRAGRVNAAAAIAPAALAVPVMSRRRVIVSPSNAPGSPRSSVYFDREPRGRSGLLMFT